MKMTQQQQQQQQILCLTTLMLLLASTNRVSAATSTTADTPAIAIPLHSIHMDTISASLRKGLRGLFLKSPPSTSSSADADHHHHHHHGFSSMIPAATPGIMDNKLKQRLMISRGSSSSSSTDIPITNSNTVRVDLDHHKDGHGGDDHHSSSEQHHDQKHSKDDKNKKQESSSSGNGNNKGRKFKVCMTHNHCYKKKLVCPKKCGKKSSSSPTSNRLLVPNHFPGHNNHCVLNCNKCVAHC